MDWDQIAGDYLAVAAGVFGELRESIDAVAEECAALMRAGGKVMACGNGGSAADAQHFAGEMINRFLRNRRPYAGLALSTDTSVLSCIGNDSSFEEVFVKQVRGLGRKGDALLGISTSGNARNVCKAFEAAREMSILTIALTGGDGGRLVSLADRVLCVSCIQATPRIQEGHQLIIHALCERIEEVLQ